MLFKSLPSGKIAALNHIAYCSVEEACCVHDSDDNKDLLLTSKTVVPRLQVSPLTKVSKHKASESNEADNGNAHWLTKEDEERGLQAYNIF